MTRRPLHFKGKFKTMKVSEETHADLTKIGHIGQTYDEVIKILIEHYKKYKNYDDFEAAE